MTTTTRAGSRVSDLLAAAGPDHFRAGAPPAGTLTLADLQHEQTVADLILQTASALTTDEHTAVGFSLYYGAAGALLGPAVATLLAGVGWAVDPARTALIVGANGMVDAVWPGWRGTADDTSDDTAAPQVVPTIDSTMRWLVPELSAVVGAFLPNLRMGARAHGAAAGGVLATLAERMGRAQGEIGPARAAARGIADAAHPLVRAARYTIVDLDRGRWSAPAGTVCCQWFRIGGGEFCAGCPRRPEPARTESRLDYLRRTLRPAVDDVPGGPG